MKVSEVLSEFNRQMALQQSAATRGAAAGALPFLVKDVRQKVWLTVVEGQRLSFSDTMQLLTGKEMGESSGLAMGPRRHAFPLVDLSEMLVKNVTPWRRWVHEDFPEMVRDIGKFVRVDENGAPVHELELPSWIVHQQKDPEPERKADENSTRAHYTDKLYQGAAGGWRRFYVWARALRRSCAKFTALLVIREAETAALSVQQAMRDAGIWGLPALSAPRTVRGIYIVSLAQAEKGIYVGAPPQRYADSLMTYVWEDDTEPTDPRDTVDIANETWHRVARLDVNDPGSHLYKPERLSQAPPFLTWLHLRHQKEYVVGNPFLTFNEYIPDDGQYNFHREHATVCYMLWYLFMMVDRGRIPAHYMSVLETSYGGDNAVTVNVLNDLHTDHRLVFYLDGNKVDRWSVLERLPLAPRQLAPHDDDDDGDAEGRPIQYWTSTLFLGGEHPPVAVHHPIDACIVCQSDSVTVRERRNPEMVFCGKKCQEEFRAQNPVE
jgi:hypothetical protein